MSFLPSSSRLLPARPTQLFSQCRCKSTVPRRVPPPKPIRNPEPIKDDPSTTHFKITLHRSTLGLPKHIGLTAKSLGFHRRFQTVYHRHTAAVAGKILTLKELVSVENVPIDGVKSRQQMNQERKAVRGYKVVKRAGLGDYGKGLTI